MGDSFFDSHDEKLALDKLRVICPSLSSVYVQEHSTQRSSQIQTLSYALTELEALRSSTSTVNSNSSSSLLGSVGTSSSATTVGTGASSASGTGRSAMLADHWMYMTLTGEWVCVGQVDVRSLAVWY